MAFRMPSAGITSRCVLQRRQLACCAVARPAGLPKQSRAATTTTKAAASSSLPALSSLASMDGGAASIPSNTLNNNFNAAVDLSSLFGGYHKIGDTVTHHAMKRFRATKTPIARYLFLRDLQLFNPKVYFHMLMTRTEEILPFIYTPTVGEACQTYHELPMLTQGLYISLRDRGNILKKLKAWQQQDVKVVVATDGERILGLGDLGCNGMGISEGKIQLYTAAAGVNPSQCLPVCIDVGTNNEELLADPKYRGLRQRRVTGAEYDSFIEEVMVAFKAWQPHMLIQFEDFGNSNAFRVLENFQDRACCFNDDVQGTACITLAGILSALRANGHQLRDQAVLFYGAGEAGTGIGELISQALVKQAEREGGQLSLDEARRHCYFMDSRGLITVSRADAASGKLAAHKVPFAHDVAPADDLLTAVQQIRPSILIGVSTVAGAFTQEVVEAMAAANTRPLIFPLSNPTSKAECTFEQAVHWTKGSVLFASGSPFPAQCYDGSCEPLQPAQANNAYIFPAVGHAAVLTKCSRIPNEMFLVAAEALSCMTSVDELAHGYLFPPFNQIRTVSAKLMAAVCAYIVDSGLGSPPEGFNGDWEATCTAAMWDV